MNNEEFLNQETLDQVEQPPVEEETPEVPQEPEAPKESDIEINMRALREAREAERKRADEAERRAQEAIELARQVASRGHAPQEEKQGPSYNYQPDDIPDVGWVQSENAKRDKEMAQLKQELYMTSVEARVRSSMPDFEKIATKENIDKLAKAYPEVHASLMQTPDLYNKARSTYTLLKQLGIVQNEKDLDMANKRIEQNQQKPRSVNSVAPQTGSSPLNKANDFANGLTEDLKNQLYKEMIEARKRL